MLIDDITIQIIGGKGGDGSVGFSRTKMALGPTGANGGKGGDVFVEGVSDLSALQQFRYTKEAKAQDGEVGTKKLRDGAAGVDFIVRVPVGTVLHNLDTSETKEITKIGERILAVKGGHGGKGNYMFRSPTNTSPRESTKGRAGESHSFRLELKMIADVGLIGLPNAGKTSLLNALTAAAAKVGNYAFTTLEPNLGAYYTLILADIPGLIEGASVGKGLGTKFLRHIERTRTLFHLISAETTDVVRDYEIIRNELAAYSSALATKPEHVFLSKSDMVAPDAVQEMLTILAKGNITAAAITVLDETGLFPVKKVLDEIAREKTTP